MSTSEVPQDYPPFSGDDPVCPKCLFVGASTEYRDHGECIHGFGSESGVIGFSPNPRLHRECMRCSYAWDEALAVQEKPRAHP